ncbi:MAG: extracellular solute-binding protein [Lachnospiraceae bacterium]
MNLGKRTISVLLTISLLLGVFYIANQVRKQEKQDIFDQTKTLHLWYADETLTDYLSSVAVKFNEEYGVRVIPVLQTGLEFLEKINEASLSGEAIPDLFIASNDNMEKAWLAGLASEITNPDKAISLEMMPESAINAVTYQYKLLGYPFYFETSALLYNMTYFENLAGEEIRVSLEEQEAAKAEEVDTQTQETEEESTESSSEEAVVLISDEELTRQARERVPSMIPATFDQLLEFADNYEAPEDVEAVFRWDVSDIFFNYFFIGDYIDVGGVFGDDSNSINLYNRDAIMALQAYQDLGQYFAIEADEVDYETVIQDFMEGKVVMTTATTEVVRRLEEAKKAGEFTYDYGIAPIPDLTDTMRTRNLSVTSTIYINGYSQLKSEANEFATWLIREHAEELYDMTGKVTANKQVVHENENISAFMQEYEDSVPMPKMLLTSNLWVEIEIAFGKIWEGAKVSNELMHLSEHLMSKVTGEEYSETYIDMPNEDEEYYEYVDEETEEASSENGTAQ